MSLQPPPGKLNSPDSITIGDIVRAFLPDIDDAEVGAIIYGETGYPAFWHTTPETPTPLAVFITQVIEAARRRRAGDSHPLDVAMKIGRDDADNERFELYDSSAYEPYEDVTVAAAGPFPDPSQDGGK